MVQVAKKDTAGKATGNVEVPAPAALTANDYAIVARSIERQRANARQPWAHTKTRAEVSGGGKKPWRQKGTGRARAGSSRSPLWRHGGVTWGPRNTRVWSKGLNKKERQRAIRVAIQDHALRGSMVLLDGLAIAKPRTKDAAAVLASLGLTGKILVVVDNPTPETAAAHDAIVKSFRNLDRVTVLPAARINAMLLVGHNHVVCTTGAWDAIQSTWFKQA